MLGQPMPSTIGIWSCGTFWMRKMPTWVHSTRNMVLSPIFAVTVTVMPVW